MEVSAATGDSGLLTLSRGRIDRFLSVLVIGLLAAIFVTLLSQVVMRYVFASPLAWSEELARYLFVWLTFLGAALAYRLGAHIAVDLLAEYLERRAGVRAGQVLALAIQAVVVAFLAALLVGGVGLVRGTTHQVTPGLGISMSWVYLAIPVGSAVMILSAAGKAFAAWRQRRSGASG